MTVVRAYETNAARVRAVFTPADTSLSALTFRELGVKPGSATRGAKIDNTGNEDGPYKMYAPAERAEVSNTEITCKFEPDQTATINTYIVNVVTGTLVITFDSGRTMTFGSMAISGDDIQEMSDGTMPRRKLTFECYGDQGGALPGSGLSGFVQINGTPKVGETLTCVIGGVLPTAAQTSGIYAWYADGTVISGATSQTLTLAAAQQGKIVTVKYTHGSYTGELTASTTAVAAAD